MNKQRNVINETDPRFPSGPWVGFFLQPQLPGRHMMELRLTFVAGTIKGEGRDWVGSFLIDGRYNVEDGKCDWVKTYLRKHDVFYRGFNEGKGIWGTWEISELVALLRLRGGFQIWPEGTRGFSNDQLKEALDLPAFRFESKPKAQPVGAPI